MVHYNVAFNHGNWWSWETVEDDAIISYLSLCIVSRSRVIRGDHYFSLEAFLPEEGHNELWPCRVMTTIPLTVSGNRSHLVIFQVSVICIHQSLGWQIWI